MDEARRQPVFLGFTIKQITPPPRPWCDDWPALVAEICSVSDCAASRVDDWMAAFDHNRGWCWDTETTALSHVPAGEELQYALYAYRAIPRVFGLAEEPVEETLDGLLWAEWPPLPPEPSLSAYERLGYDVVGHDRSYGIAGWQCSPLSCCGLATEYPVNRYCLLDDLDVALAAARRFGIEEPEPGPYVVVEVLRRLPTLNVEEPA